jgi:predicted RNase H-like nuclease (RuvC/YqgF family)
MQAYGRMAKDKTLEIDAAEIRIRAERRLGELLSLQKNADGFNKGGRPAEITGTLPGPVISPTLAEAGISKNLSSRAQKLAAVPNDEFESEVSDWRERVGKENARVSARLEQKGEEAIKRQEGNDEDIINEENNEDYDPKEQEIRNELYGDVDPQKEIEKAHKEIDDLNKEIERLNKIIESNDMLSEIKKLSDLNQVLESQKNGYIVSLNDQKSYSKMWKAKFEKLEKSMKASGLVQF